MTRKEAVKTLLRRSNHLAARVHGVQGQDLSFDRREIAAIRRVVADLERAVRRVAELEAERLPKPE